MNFQINTFRAQKPMTSVKSSPKSKDDSSTSSPRRSHNDEKITKKRRRLTLVCDNCKKRKIRCNKQMPCDSCLKSNISHSCAYHDTWPKKGVISSSVTDKNAPDQDLNSLSRSLPYISSARRPIILENNIDHNKHKPMDSHKKKDEVASVQEDSKIIDVYKQELERLKDRIKHLESINHINPVISSPAKDPVSATLPLPIPSPLVPPGTVTTSYLSTQVVPIKLPPINWKSTAIPTTTSTSTGPSHSNESSTTVASYPHSTIASSSPSVIPIANSSSMLTSFIGINPVFQLEETISSYKYAKTCPFTWSVLMMSDPQLRVVLDYIKSGGVKVDEHLTCPTSKPAEAIKIDLNYSLLLRDSVTHKAIKQGQVEEDLVTRLISSLPKYDVLMRLMNQHFTFNYPMFAFIDEMKFRSDVVRIVKFDYKDQTITNFEFNDYKHDLCIIGTLLIILRLAFLSLLRNNHGYNIAIIKQDSAMFEKPINLDHVSLARECLIKILFDYKYEEFVAVQFLFCVRYYIRIAPEDGYRKDTIDYNSKLTELALKLKLNHDPDVLPGICDLTIREKSLRRKTWHFIMMADIHISLEFGNPSTYRDIVTNTKRPFPVTLESESNLNDFKYEQAIFNDVYSRSFQFHSSMKEMSEFVTNSNGYQLVRLIDQLNEFEVCVSDYFKNLFDYLLNGLNGDEEPDGISNFRRIYDLKIYLSVINFITTIYYYIYLFYEDQNLNISFFYLKKTIIYINELLPFYQKLIFNNVLRSDFLFNPTLQGAIHKSSQILLSLLIKFRGDDAYKDLRESMFKNYIIFVESLENLSTRYFYSWKITKGHRYFSAIINSNGFAKFYMNQKKNNEFRTMKYNIYQVKELQDIIEYSLHRFDHLHQQQQLQKQQQLHPPYPLQEGFKEKVEHDHNQQHEHQHVHDHQHDHDHDHDHQQQPSYVPTMVTDPHSNPKENKEEKDKYNGRVDITNSLTNDITSNNDFQIDQQWFDLVWQFSGKNDATYDALGSQSVAPAPDATNSTATVTRQESLVAPGKGSNAGLGGVDAMSTPLLSIFDIYDEFNRINSPP